MRNGHFRDGCTRAYHRLLHFCGTLMAELLRIDNLTVDLPPGADRPDAIKGLSLSVNAGEILCVVGESGSGKSLTAGAILGLLPPGVRAGAGQVLWEGQDLLRLPEDALRRLRGK